jgi:hypothetical protein
LWLRRIAPDTHLDQATSLTTAFALAAFAAPEERWCRFVSNGLITDPWLPIFWGANPWLAHVAGDPLLLLG